MRTTVNIEAHLLAEAKVLAARTNRSLGAVIDDALRVAIAERQHQRAPVVLPVDGDPDARPLVDIHDNEALVEALGDNTWPRANR